MSCWRIPTFLALLPPDEKGGRGEARRTQPRTRGQLSHQLCLSEAHIQRSVGARRPQGSALTAPRMALRLCPAHPAGRPGFQDLGVVLRWLLPRGSQPRETKPRGQGRKRQLLSACFSGGEDTRGHCPSSLVGQAPASPARAPSLPTRAA